MFGILFVFLGRFGTFFGFLRQFYVGCATFRPKWCHLVRNPRIGPARRTVVGFSRGTSSLQASQRINQMETIGTFFLPLSCSPASGGWQCGRWLAWRPRLRPAAEHRSTVLQGLYRPVLGGAAGADADCGAWPASRTVSQTPSQIGARHQAGTRSGNTPTKA